jgi:hypothetical protein
MLAKKINCKHRCKSKALLLLQTAKKKFAMQGQFAACANTGA